MLGIEAHWGLWREWAIPQLLGTPLVSSDRNSSSTPRKLLHYADSRVDLYCTLLKKGSSKIISVTNRLHFPLYFPPTFYRCHSKGFGPFFFLYGFPSKSFIVLRYYDVKSYSTCQQHLPRYTDDFIKYCYTFVR